ncbi:MAG: hypothetical protein ACFFG0_49890 [Candidatus Thorarchaeota archaeon]
MTKNNSKSKQNRLGEIEDRKLEIILEIADINNNYNEKVSLLNSEYARLDKEYYNIKLGLIRRKTEK